MTLDSSAASFLQMLVEAGRPPLHESLPVDARAGYDATVPFAGEGADVEFVSELTIDGVPCHLIRPKNVAKPPVLVWFHGGGWVIGSSAASLAVCQDLAASAGCAVISVDYRLAPEHPAPAALMDCAAVTKWVLEHGREIGLDHSRVAVGGDSAGGNLAALVALELGEALCHQALVYPVVDLTLSHPSIDENAEGYLLTKAGMQWFVGHYLGGTGISAGDESVSPLAAAPERMRKTASASVLIAGFDPLRDEGAAYASALAKAGVSCELRSFPGQIHAFFTLRELIPEGGDAIEWVAQRLSSAFG